MTTGVVDKFIVGNESLEVVDSLIFLGTEIDKTGTCSKKLKRRLALGRVALRKLDKIWKSNDVSIGTKRRLVQALVFPVVMYGAETWTVLKTDRKKINAFELWCWRRILKVPWTKKITNKEMLEKIQPEYSLEAMIIKLRLGYVGHVLRKPTSMENSTMLGKTEGTRRRGRPRTRWMDGVKEAVGTKLGQLKEVVKDWKLWRKVIMEATRNRTRIDGT